ncbi:MAG: ABC transporter substrate-binding protein [Chloroflexota bacterium]|nr:ABC transporter substrate-binding protein [Chloroflexota bacterium]
MAGIRASRRDLLRYGAGSVSSLAVAGLTGKPSFSVNEALAQDDRVEIEYWHINTEVFGGPAVKEITAAFQAQNPNIAVAERFQQNAYTGLLENLQTSLAAGNPPDIAQIGYLYLDYVKTNFPYTPANELDEALGGGTFLSNFPETVLELGQAGGVQLGLPYAISNPITYYNADMLAQAGIDPADPPTTWDEWLAASQTIKKQQGKATVYVQLLDDNWTTQGLIESNGGQMLSCGGDAATATFDSPEGIEAIDLWARMCKDGYSLNVLNDQGMQAFLAGEVASYITTCARRQVLQEQASFDLRATTFPAFGTKEVRLPAGGNVLVVFSEDDAKKAAAWKFIQFMQSPEALTTWVKGTGYISPRPSVAEDPNLLGAFVRENPIQAVAIAQTANVRPWISFPGANGLQAAKSLFAATQEALGGQSTTEVALKDAAKEINDLIEGQSCA